MFSGITLLALAAAVLLIALVKAIQQNQAMGRQLKGIARPVPALLRDALVLWSPLALVIVLMVMVAVRLSSAAIALTYRMTTLDQFCAVQGLDRPVVIPCTGMHSVLPPDTLRRVGAQADLDHLLARRYREQRQVLLAITPEELRKMSSNRRALLRSLAPPGVLGMEQAPEDDQELTRLKVELRALLRTPTPRAKDVLDIVRFVTEREARVQRMRLLTSMVRARREKVNAEAYASLPRAAQGPLWLRHRIAHITSRVASRPDAATTLALDKLVAETTTDETSMPQIRRGLVSVLARDEAAVASLLVHETETDKSVAALYLALAMPRRCTVATADPLLRLKVSDFSAVRGEGAAGNADVLASNSGSFSCFRVPAEAGPLQLQPLDFRQSVARSIDRWHDQMVQASFRRVGAVGSSLAFADPDTAAEALASAVPGGIQLGRSECGWFKPLNCLANAAREAVEEGYVEARAEVGRSAVAVVSPASQGLDTRLGEKLATLDADLETMRTSAHVYAQRFFLAGDMLQLLGWLALALIVVKSFLYVLALEIFHSDEQMRIGFETTQAVQGDYSSGRQVTIARDFKVPLVTRKQLSNTDNNVRLAPWPWSAPLARMLSGRYFIFTKGSFLSDSHQPDGSEPPGMVASASGGLSIVEWRMQPGEEVIFRYKDFYGASENVRLSSEISLRLSTLLLGRIVFRIAHCGPGEGRLLLKANVEEVDQRQLRAVPPERMIAWNRHAEFTIHSSRTLWKTLLNGYTLVRRERGDGRSGLIVVSSDDVGSNLGSIRFVRRIFGAIF